MECNISVIIPAYNEEARIRPTIEKISSYLQENFRESEIIVVDDGSSDNTAAFIQNLITKYPDIRLIHYPVNSGKGYAIKTGVLSSRGDLLLTCDADMSTPVEELEKFIAEFHHAEAGLLFNSGYDANLGLFSCIAKKKIH